MVTTGVGWVAWLFLADEASEATTFVVMTFGVILATTFGACFTAVFVATAGRIIDDVDAAPEEVEPTPIPIPPIPASDPAIAERADITTRVQGSMISVA